MSHSEWVILIICSTCQVVKCQKRLMEHLRDLQKQKINIYIEYRANLKNLLLCDLILLAWSYLVSAFLLSFDSPRIPFIYAWIHHNKKERFASPYICAHSRHTHFDFLQLCTLFVFTETTSAEGWWDSGSIARLVHESGVIFETNTFQFHP